MPPSVIDILDYQMWRWRSFQILSVRYQHVKCEVYRVQWDTASLIMINLISHRLSHESDLQLQPKSRKCTSTDFYRDKLDSDVIYATIHYQDIVI